LLRVCFGSAALAAGARHKSVTPADLTGRKSLCESFRNLAKEVKRERSDGMSGILSDVGGLAKGFGQGLWGGAKGMVQGQGSLAEGAYDIATAPNARAQAWNDAANAAQTVEWAA
jgi:hypothetical protein